MPAFNIDQFRSTLQGGARPNQFEVTLTFPSGIENGAGAVAPFLVTAASLPGQTIPPATVLYRGREVHLAGDRTFVPWTTTIINDSTFIVRAALERWMNTIEDMGTKVGRIEPRNYLATLYVTQLDKNGTDLRTYQFIDAYPTDISEVGLSFGANNDISTFTCTWQYQHFYPYEGTGLVSENNVSSASLFRR